MTPGRLFVISSPSGGGKTTVVRAVLKSEPELVYSVSATTRPMRKGEIDGRDYHFITPDRFQDGIRKGDFLEWAEVHGSFYGTLKGEVEPRLSEGRSVLLDLDVQGGMSVKHMNADSVLIFLLPPSIRVLEERLKGRGTEDASTIARRLSAAEREMKQADRYNFIIFNDDLRITVDEVRTIIRQATSG